MPADDNRVADHLSANGVFTPLDEKVIDTRPTGHHRYVVRPLPPGEMDVNKPYVRRIHQMEWITLTFQGAKIIDRKTEWRDVPLVAEEPVAAPVGYQRMVEGG